MDAKKCILTRRSIRKYKARDVSEKKIKKMIEYAIHAPSSCNTQHWEFIIVREKKMKKELSNVHRFCSFIKDAPVVIVICSDTSKSQYSPSGLVSVAAAVENLLLGIHNEGLGACWVYVKDDDEPGIEKNVQRYLGIPKSVDVLCMVSVGYPDEKPCEKKTRKLDEVIHEEKWN